VAPEGLRPRDSCRYLVTGAGFAASMGSCRRTRRPTMAAMPATAGSGSRPRTWPDRRAATVPARVPPGGDGQVLALWGDGPAVDDFETGGVPLALPTAPSRQPIVTGSVTDKRGAGFFSAPHGIAVDSAGASTLRTPRSRGSGSIGGIGPSRSSYGCSGGPPSVFRASRVLVIADRFVPVGREPATPPPLIRLGRPVGRHSWLRSVVGRENPTWNGEARRLLPSGGNWRAPRAIARGSRFPGWRYDVFRHIP
jgi:hypothetical protein